MPNLNGFNANDVDPAVGFDPVPADKYLAIITESEMKDTKTGDGKYLQFTFQILEGEFKGRMLWTRLNLENSKPTAVKIARAELSAICRSVNVMSPRDSVELHNLPLIISVGHKKRKDTGEITNVIKGYDRKEAVAARPTAAGSNNGTPPWKR